MGNSFLLIVAGLLIFYLVISDKWKCVEGFFACVTGKTNQPATNSTTPAPTSTPIIRPTTPATLVSYSNILNGGGYGF